MWGAATVARLKVEMEARELVKNRSLVGFALVMVIIGSLVSPVALQSQTSYTQPNTTNVCVAATLKYFNPNMTSPTVVAVIAKFLTAPRVCSSVAMNNAFCNPGVAALTSTLAATAIGSQITMMPSCQWACAGCPNVTTSGGDGLPVELMGFGFEDDETSD